MDQVECVVVGAGVVGLAIARAAAQAGHDVLILEAGRQFGQGISSRNSEVIHAGLYYPTGSMRAKLCLEGRNRLYEYCRDHGVEHRRLGKLVVATDMTQWAKLDELHRQAMANGVNDVRWLSAGDVHRLEPDICCIGGLLSPSTGHHRQPRPDAVLSR